VIDLVTATILLMVKMQVMPLLPMVISPRMMPLPVVV
jgi:hypothetical protein